MKVSKTLKINGRVQGVGFRESMLEQALRLGVKGWVRNRLDGSVEALVQGDATPVEDLVAWCHMGPAQAKVTRVMINPAPNEEIAEKFLKLETE
ncbi:MAG: acylphosphatase [Proteobacteria bacterium]|nr:MAG: acylphosphatase [Pseudomonadota bacterium]